MLQIPVMLLSDLHFHAFKAHSRLIDGVNSRLLDVLSVCNQALALARAHRVELLLIPGDIFHIRGQIRPSTFNTAVEWFHSVLKAGIDVVLIPGNHDMESFRGGASSVHALAYLESPRGRSRRRIHVLTEAQPLLRLPGGPAILGIPYIHDHDRFRDEFRRLTQAHAPDITLIHQGIDDFDFEGSPKTGLTAHFLLKENPGLIVSGHYHKPARAGRLINPGAPLQHRLSDQGQARGCWILEPGAEPRFHALSAPQFVTVDATEGPPDLHNLRGNFAHIKARDVAVAQEAREAALAGGAASVQVHIEREYRPAKTETMAISSPRAMLQEYCAMVERYRPRQEAILKAFDRLNLGGRDL